MVLASGELCRLAVNWVTNQQPLEAPMPHLTFHFISFICAYIQLRLFTQCLMKKQLNTTAGLSATGESRL